MTGDHQPAGTVARGTRMPIHRVAKGGNTSDLVGKERCQARWSVRVGRTGATAQYAGQVDSVACAGAVAEATALGTLSGSMKSVIWIAPASAGAGLLRAPPAPPPAPASPPAPGLPRELHQTGPRVRPLTLSG